MNLKKWLPAIVLGVLGLISLGLMASHIPAPSNAYAASGAIFVGNQFECSGTEIGNDGKDGFFLTARHCATDLDTDEMHEHLLVTFAGNEQGPFYAATPIAISLTDDLAILRVINGANLPTVKIVDEHKLHADAHIHNVSYPEGDGKLTFNGQFMAPRFPCLACDPQNVLQDYPFWANSMPVNCTWAPGSSGSGIFDARNELIGVVVGSTGSGQYNIAIPSDRVINLLQHISDNTITKFEQKFPVHAAPDR